MKTKKFMAILLAALMLFTSSCNVKTKDDVKPVENTEKQSGTEDIAQEDKGERKETAQITIATMSSNETIANVVRDQLTKTGFDVKLNMQPDYSSYKAQTDANNFDVMIIDWSTDTGNGDYAVRSLFTSGGDYNPTKINDPELDKMIDEAATMTADKALEAYRAIEDKIVEENAYIIPLYNSMKMQAYNKEILKPVTIAKDRSPALEKFDFIDESKRDVEPLYIVHAYDSITSLDPIKADDGASSMNNTNIYVRLMNLADNNEPTTDGTLTYNYAIAEGNSNMYFILRDDINFAKVVDKKAVDTGEMVSAEDVVFSLSRAKDKDSVPDQRTYSVHNSMDEVRIVTDKSVLESTKVSGSDASVLEELGKGLTVPIEEIVADAGSVDNSAGKYQVVEVTTKTPFPQILNTLAHTSGGIVSKKQVESINTYDMATYDINKDVAYGDQRSIIEGDTYDNTLYCSGPYVAIYKNDYEIYYEKNPNFMRGTDSEPKIATVRSKIIKDYDSSISALRSGEVHFVSKVDVTSYDILKGDSKIEVLEGPSSRVYFLGCNQSSESICSDVNIRKAMLYSINQDEIIAVFNNMVNKAYTTLTPVVNTGKVHESDPAKAKEYLDKYYEGK